MFDTDAKISILTRSGSSQEIVIEIIAKMRDSMYLPAV